MPCADKIKDFWFNVTHLPGARNLTDQLMHGGFADGQGPAALTGDQELESLQELFSRLDPDTPSEDRANYNGLQYQLQ